MQNSTFEFDAFGPWVYEIGGDHKLPRLFKNFESILEKAELAAKIPRNIDRRNASPTMHLYDMVIGIFPDHLLILKRNINSVIDQKLYFSNISFLSRTECLLIGELLFASNNTEVKISYNTVSRKLVSQITDMIRERIPAAKKKLILNKIPYPGEMMDTLFKNLYHHMSRTEPDTELIAFQPSFYIKRNPDLLSVISGNYSEKELISSSMYFTNKREMIIIDRSTHEQQNKETVTAYSYTYTYIPLDKINNISIENNSIPGRLVIDLKHSSRSFPIDTGNHNFSMS